MSGFRGRKNLVNGEVFGPAEGWMEFALIHVSKRTSGSEEQRRNVVGPAIVE
jgi:hypothetical protein